MFKLKIACRREANGLVNDKGKPHMHCQARNLLMSWQACYARVSSKSSK